MIRDPNRAPVTTQALQPAGPSNGLDGRADPATFGPQSLGVAEIEPDRPRGTNPSIDMSAYAPKMPFEDVKMYRLDR